MCNSWLALNVDRLAFEVSIRGWPQDHLSNVPDIHHDIGSSENSAQRFGPFLQSNAGDPAILVCILSSSTLSRQLTLEQDFWQKLKNHLLLRIKAAQMPNSPKSSSFEAAPTAELNCLFFKKECMFKHNIMRINYTTYDVRRAQDVINPNTEHRDIMLLSASEDLNNHQYAYARVLGIYHVNIIYTGPNSSNYSAKRMEFLWVRWFAVVDDEPVERSWDRQQLDSLQLLPVQHKDAFGFVDPANVLRGVHVIPRFAMGRQHAVGKGISQCARDSQDWHQYYVGR
jgi:hypothetical protein